MCGGSVYPERCRDVAFFIVRNVFVGKIIYHRGGNMVNLMSLILV